MVSRFAAEGIGSKVIAAPDAHLSASKLQLTPATHETPFLGALCGSLPWVPSKVYSCGHE
jgi:hypothetical protein